MMTLPLKGTITALVTPMHKDGSIDYTSLKRLIDFQIEGNISAIVACGSTGESATMSFTEKCDVMRTTVEYVAGRVPVIRMILRRPLRSQRKQKRLVQMLSCLFHHFIINQLNAA